MEQRSSTRPALLLVDDDELWLKALKRLVRPMRSVAVQAETDVARALDCIARGAPQIVVTDIDMHGDSAAGIAVVEAARRAGIPVAVVSSGPGEAERSKLVGVTIFDKARLAVGDCAAFLGHLSAFERDAAAPPRVEAPAPQR